MKSRFRKLDLIASNSVPQVRYAEQRGVGILLWHAYPGNRKDGPGLTRPEARELSFQRCRDAGVRGIKIDSLDRWTFFAAHPLDGPRRAVRVRLERAFGGAGSYIAVIQPATRSR